MSTTMTIDQTKVANGKSTASLTPQQAELARLQAENARLQKALEAASRPGAIRLSVGEKGGISVLGLQGFPVTLYAYQLMRLCMATNSIKEFIVREWDRLSFKHKDGSPAPEQAAAVEKWVAE